MTAAEAKQLKVGERVRWIDNAGPEVEPEDDGTITEVLPGCLVIAWDSFADSDIPNRPIAYEHCANVYRAGPAGWTHVTA